MATKKREAEYQEIVIKPLKMNHAVFKIIGTAPLVINKFSKKAREEMEEKQKLGSMAAKAKKTKPPKDFEDVYNGHRHISREGWDGLPATAIRAAMIRAAGIAGYVMTMSKVGFSIDQDGFDADDDTPLIKITNAEPIMKKDYVRLATGQSDITARPKYDIGWEAEVRVKYDADIFSSTDIANMLHRAGEQVGICAGRPFSSKSAGMNWGTFTIAGKEEIKQV